jgi:streptogramin lyase
MTIEHLTDSQLDDRLRAYLTWQADRVAARSAGPDATAEALARRLGLVTRPRRVAWSYVRFALAVLLLILALIAAAAVGGLLRDPYTPDLPLLEVPLDGSPWGVTGAYDSIWVSSADGRDIRRIDPRDGQVRNDIAVVAHMCGNIRAGFDALWISHCEANTISRIDARTLDVARLTGYDTDQIAISPDSVWVSKATSAVRLDPSTLDTRAEIDVGGGSLLEFGDGAIWATVPNLAVVRRIDPASNRVVATITIPQTGADAANPVHSVFGGGALWVVDEPAGHLYRIDRASNSAQLVPLAFSSFDGQFGDWFITYGRGRVWVRNAGDAIVAIDPATLTVTDTITTPEGGVGGFFVADHSIWLGNNSAGTLWGVQLP